MASAPCGQEKHSYSVFLSADFEAMELDDSLPKPLEVQLVSELRRIGDECYTLAEELEAKRNAVLSIRNKRNARNRKTAAA